MKNGTFGLFYFPSRPQGNRLHTHKKSAGIWYVIKPNLQQARILGLLRRISLLKRTLNGGGGDYGSGAAAIFASVVLPISISPLSAVLYGRTAHLSDQKKGELLFQIFVHVFSIHVNTNWQIIK